jgi:formylglycine-generating enzyme required for sulfatase activity
MSARNILLFILLTFVVILFSLRSSKLNLYDNYEKLKIFSSDSIIFNENIFSIFSDNFTLTLDSPGYETTIYSGSHQDGVHLIKLQKKPIQLIFSELKQEPSKIVINGMQKTIESAILEEGKNQIYLEFNDFLPFSNVIEITKELEYPLNVELTQINKKITFLNLIANDLIYINDKLIETNNILFLTANNTNIKIKRDGRFILNSDYKVNDNHDLNITLKKNLTSLKLNFVQSKVDIFVNKNFIGTSVESITGIKTGDVIAFTKEYFRSEIIEYSGEKELIVVLKPQLGTLQIFNPQNTMVYVNQKLFNNFNVKVPIEAGKYVVNAKNEGYVDQKYNIEITDKKNTEVNIKLLTIKEHALLNSPKSYSNSIGINLLLNAPGNIIIGSPKSEYRRKKNEIERKISITRHFYLSESLVSENQYNRLVGKSGGENLPITNISWIDSAIFCNLLSKKENLDPFYIFENSKLKGFNLLSTGYRLPTEAEWEYVISQPNKMGKKIFIYPWGNSEKLNDPLGNLSDENSANKKIIPNYIDDHKGLSPINSYPKSYSGYYDHLGNAREWVNDFYSEEITNNDNIYIEDYIGPLLGQSHVVKGSSYLSYNLTELGTSYRTFSVSGKKDIGFRVARWIY